MLQRKFLAIVCALFCATTFFGQSPFGFGAEIDLDQYNSAELANFERLGFADATATSISLRKYSPFPQSQGQYGTCVGWASAYGAYTIQYAIRNNITNRYTITANAFDPYYTYELAQRKNDATCQTGTYVYHALLNARTDGMKRMYLNIYDCDPYISETTKANSRNLRIRGFKRLFTYPEGGDEDWNIFFDYNIDKVSPIKQALANNYPVIVSMKIPASFQAVGTQKFWTPTEYERSNAGDLGNNKSLGGHAMCVIGYDDTKGAFEIMNSWGGEWGDQGYIWVKYEDFNMWCAEAYFMDFFEDKPPTSGCIFGDCDNQYSRYVFEDGDMYEGGLEGGYFNGDGLYVYSNGDAYAGEWKDGKRHGVGIFFRQGIQPVMSYWDMGTSVEYAVSNTEVEPTTVSTGCVDGNCYNGHGVYVYEQDGIRTTYTGTFKNGMMDGYGTLEFSDGYRLSGTFEADALDGIGKMEEINGVSYVGQYALSKKSGYGILYGSKGFFGGVWVSGKYMDPNEPSALKPADDNKPSQKPLELRFGTGDAAPGCASGDCQNGYGTINYSDGYVYTGYFQDGLRHGYGKIVGRDGYTLEGFWSNGNMDGIGTITWPDGTFFVGEFRRGKQDGYGIEVRTDSTFVAGIWEFGEYKPGKSNLGFASVEDFPEDVDVKVAKSPARQSLDLYMNSIKNHPSVK